MINNNSNYFNDDDENTQPDNEVSSTSKVLALKVEDLVSSHDILQKATNACNLVLYVKVKW